MRATVTTAERDVARTSDPREDRRRATSCVVVVTVEGTTMEAPAPILCDEAFAGTEDYIYLV